MYLEHFHLKSQPFAEHAAVAALWQDQRMDEGLARLEYLVQCGQLGLVTGASGLGKSALLKRFFHGLSPQQCQAVYCHLTHLPSASVLKMVSVRYQLRPLSREQTSRYIDFQLHQAGGDLKLFDESVKGAVHDFTGGVPRQINSLATACLLQATARKLVRIDEDLFQQAVSEFQLP